MHRVMIIGSAGSGKSTLAAQLSNKTGLPVVHIDKIYWTSGWIMRSKDEIRLMIEEAVQSAGWIFDGNHSSSFDLRVARADTLVFLDIRAHICLFRVLKRVLQGYGRVRADMAPGCPERFDWPFFKWVYGYGRKGRPKALKLLQEAPSSVTKFHLKDRKAVANFLRSV